MKTAKVVYVIPGFRHTPKTKAYQKIAKILRGEGYKPVLVKIPWRQTTISENTEYFLKQYKKIKTRKKYILGFSFGAMIAMLASTKVSPSGLILCSLSPYFKEDIAKSGRGLRYEDFSKLHCKTLAKKVKAKSVNMLYGTKETKPLIRRVTKAYRQISASKKRLVAIKNIEHDIANKHYLQTIHTITKTLH